MACLNIVYLSNNNKKKKHQEKEEENKNQEKEYLNLKLGLGTVKQTSWISSIQSGGRVSTVCTSYVVQTGMCEPLREGETCEEAVCSIGTSPMTKSEPLTTKLDQYHPFPPLWSIRKFQLTNL